MPTNDRSLFERLSGSLRDDNDLSQREEYVQRNVTNAELDELPRDPEPIHAAREHLGEVFESEELDPRSTARR